MLKDVHKHTLAFGFLVSRAPAGFGAESREKTEGWKGVTQTEGHWDAFSAQSYFLWTRCRNYSWSFQALCSSAWRKPFCTCLWKTISTNKFLEEKLLLWTPMFSLSLTNYIEVKHYFIPYSAAVSAEIFWRLWKKIWMTGCEETWCLESYASSFWVSSSQWLSAPSGNPSVANKACFVGESPIFVPVSGANVTYCISERLEYLSHISS